MHGPRIARLFSKRETLGMVQTRSKSEKRAEVEAWRASGISLVRFASERGYSRSALEKWAQAVREEDKSISAPRFVRLAAASVPSIPSRY
jgi:hypothetical protein